MKTDAKVQITTHATVILLLEKFSIFTFIGHKYAKAQSVTKKTKIKTTCLYLFVAFCLRGKNGPKYA